MSPIEKFVKEHKVDRSNTWVSVFLALREYRMTNMVFRDEGDPYCLVDLMTADGESIENGELEMVSLADDIVARIDGGIDKPNGGITQVFNDPSKDFQLMLVRVLSSFNNSKYPVDSKVMEVLDQANDLLRRKGTLDPLRRSCDVKEDNQLTEAFVTASGYILFVEDNGVGGRRYWSDEIGSGVMVWDTSLVSHQTLKAAMDAEEGRSDRE